MKPCGLNCGHKQWQSAPAQSSMLQVEGVAMPALARSTFPLCKRHWPMDSKAGMSCCFEMDAVWHHVTLWQLEVMSPSVLCWRPSHEAHLTSPASPDMLFFFRFTHQFQVSGLQVCAKARMRVFEEICRVPVTWTAHMLLWCVMISNAEPKNHGGVGLSLEGWWFWRPISGLLLHGGWDIFLSHPHSPIICLSFTLWQTNLTT